MKTGSISKRMGARLEHRAQMKVLLSQTNFARSQLFKGSLSDAEVPSLPVQKGEYVAVISNPRYGLKRLAAQPPQRCRQDYTERFTLHLEINTLLPWCDTVLTNTMTAVLPSADNVNNAIAARHGGRKIPPGTNNRRKN
jgi:hypothetical protein